MYEDFFVFLISRYGRERMGLTEAEAVGKMWSGVKAMIEVGQPPHVATDAASSERVMRRKIANNFAIILQLTYYSRPSIPVVSQLYWPQC